MVENSENLIYNKKNPIYGMWSYHIQKEEVDMEFEKLVSPSLKDLFISHIEAMILSGELPVGQQLPPERQLAQSMGVSRAVVNSGVVELERRGFLEIRPRVGTFVTDYRRAGTLETLKSIMTYNRGHLRNEEIRSILEVRDALAADGVVYDRITGTYSLDETGTPVKGASIIAFEAGTGADGKPAVVSKLLDVVTELPQV